MTQDGDRWRLHSLLKEFAWAKLDSAEKAATRSSHLAHFVKLITQHDHAFDSHQQTAAVQAFASHHNDLTHAWQHALDSQAWSLADAMLPTLDAYFAIVNRYADARANAQAFATALRAAHQRDYLGHAIAYSLDMDMPDGGATPAVVEEMAALCQADGRPAVLTIAAFHLANAANNRHDFAAAWELGEQVYRYAAQAEMGRFIVSGLLLQANVSIPQRLNRPKAGQAKFRQALAHAIEHGDRRSEAIVRHNIGFFLHYDGSFAEAETMFNEVVALQTELGSPVLASIGAMMQVRAIAAQVRLDEAERLALRTIDQARDLAYPIVLLQLLTVLGTEIYPEQGRPEEAATLALFVLAHPDCSPQVKLHLEEVMDGILAGISAEKQAVAREKAQQLTLDTLFDS